MAVQRKTNRFEQLRSGLAERVAEVRGRDLDSLTRREREAVCVMAAGLANQGIREALTRG